jgi:hypothetical protein
MKRFALLMIAIPACGGSSSTTPDAASTIDGASSHVTVSGKTEEIKNLAAQGIGGTVVKAFASSGGSMLATTTSASDGTYSITIPTDGSPLDGYVMGHHDPVGSNTYLDTYLYPPHPLDADSDQGVILLLTPDTLNVLTGVANVTQDPSKGMIGLVVADASGTPIAGAKVTTDPMGTVVYDSGSLPSSSASMTDTDGRAYVFNVTAGPVTLHATGGMTFRDVSLDARAGVVTTAAVEP